MNATTDLEPLLIAADPLAGGGAELPPLTTEIEGAQAAASAFVSPPTHAAWPRRPVLVGVAVVGLAAAAVIASVALPGGSPGAPPSASAAQLRQLVANVRSSPPVARVTTAYRVWDLNGVPTTTGYARYHQHSIETVTVSSRGTNYRDVFGAPRWLTPADAQRGRHVTQPGMPQRGVIRNHVAPCAGGDGFYCVSSQYLASLPTTPDALAARLQSDAINGRGGCAGGPGCLTRNLMPLLFAPGASGPLRSAVLELLAKAPGITVLGDRTVDGHPGFAFRNAYGNEGANLTEVLVVDVRDGSMLADRYYATEAYMREEPLDVPVGTLIGSQTRIG